MIEISKLKKNMKWILMVVSLIVLYAAMMAVFVALPAYLMSILFDDGKEDVYVSLSTYGEFFDLIDNADYKYTGVTYYNMENVIWLIDQSGQTVVTPGKKLRVSFPFSVSVKSSISYDGETYEKEYTRTFESVDDIQRKLFPTIRHEIPLRVANSNNPAGTGLVREQEFNADVNCKLFLTDDFECEIPVYTVKDEYILATRYNEGDIIDFSERSDSEADSGYSSYHGHSQTNTTDPIPSEPPAPSPTPTPEHYSGIQINVTDYCYDYNKVGNEWSKKHYASWDGYNWVEVPPNGAWYSVSSDKTLHIKTVITENDSISDTNTNMYQMDLPISSSLSGSSWEINQWTDIVENNGRYSGNSCRWYTDWTITYQCSY